ncbi:MAG: dehydrogenase [Thiotrichales bacterium]|nr:dehydrogenase [Thiotrichales bacterium]
MVERFLQGKTAWVTGGASGMGKAIALRLAGAGANVAIGSLLGETDATMPHDADTYLPTAKELSDVAADIERQNVAAYAAALNVRCDDSVQSFFEAATKALGPVDVLVNAAGMDVHHLVADHPDEPWHRVIDTNLNGNFRTIKRCLPAMQSRGWGRIVMIASTAASIGSPSNAAYCTSKAGLLGLMRCVALEGGPHGVTCNAVSPGYVDTPMAHSSFVHAVERGEAESVGAARKAAIAAYPQGEFIQPEDIANTVAFLCSEEAKRVTMEDVRVSAGALW